MIKEIAEEYNMQNRINVLNLLKQIKDLDYAVNKDKFRRTYLVNKSEKEQVKILIYFSKRQEQIEEILIKTLMSDKEIVSIKSGLDTHGVVSISKELYNRFLAV